MLSILRCPNFEGEKNNIITTMLLQVKLLLVCSNQKMV